MLFEVDPREVRLRWRRRQPELLELRLNECPLDDRPLDPPRDIVLMADRLGRGRLGDRVDRKRLADGIDGGAKARRAQGVSDPKAGETVHLAEGAKEDQVRKVGQEVDGGV